MMKVLIAPDKFKGSLTAAEVALAIEVGVKKWNPEIETVLLPLADGGEGTLAVLEQSLTLESVRLTVRDPLFRAVVAEYKLAGDTAYIEMATASGLLLLDPKERNCLKTTTFGTGELIRDALTRGAKKIYLFIGGSATNDAGLGMAEALGYQFLDWEGEVLLPVGENLQKIRHIDQKGLIPGLAECQFFVVTDVQNPLYGPEGAAYVYAEQKGADAATIQQLDTGLQHFAHIVKEDFGREVAYEAGAGAAGGLGAGAMIFLQATVLPGIETILDLLDFDEKLSGIDLVITGEGKVDRQTLSGKLVMGLAQRCQQFSVPISLVCGSLDIPYHELNERGIHPVFPILLKNMSLEDAMQNAEKHLRMRAYQVMVIVNHAKEKPA